MFGKKKKQSEPPGDQPMLRCSFCNKSQRDVSILIAGPKVNICNECVNICEDIIAEKRKETPDGEEPVSPTWPRSTTHFCALCCLPVTVAEAIVVENRGLICRGCRGEIEAAIAREKLP